VRAALDGLEARGRAALLERAAERFDLLADLGDELARALVERPPAQAPDGDAIRAGYDRELDEVKDARDGGKQYIASLQARERERTGIASLKVGFNKVFGYYIEDLVDRKSTRLNSSHVSISYAVFCLKKKKKTKKKNIQQKKQK